MAIAAQVPKKQPAISLPPPLLFLPIWRIIPIAFAAKTCGKQGVHTVDSTEKKRAFLIRAAYLIFCLGAIYLGLKFVLPFVMPFFIAYCIAFLLKPIIRFITNKTPLKRKFVAVLVLTLFYLVIGSLLVLLAVRIGVWAGGWFANLPEYYSQFIQPTIDKFSSSVAEFLPAAELWLPVSNFSLADTISGALSSLITATSSFVVDFVTGFAGQVPWVVVSIVITIISSFFFTADYHRISHFILRQMPSGIRHKFLVIKEFIVGTLFKFLRAYLLIISITFAEVAIGLLILRSENPFGIALITAIVDILPVFGTGTVLIPWALYALVNENYFFGVGILVLYAVITIVRQIIEPRIVGRQIGLYPLLTLICMFLGARMFGAVGLFGFPITLVVLVHLNRCGEIKLFTE